MPPDSEASAADAGLQPALEAAKEQLKNLLAQRCGFGSPMPAGIDQWVDVLELHPWPREPIACGRVRSQLAAVARHITTLLDERKDLDPRLDRDEIQAINQRLLELREEQQKLSQRKAAGAEVDQAAAAGGVADAVAVVLDAGGGDGGDLDGGGVAWEWRAVLERDSRTTAVRSAAIAGGM